VGSNCCSCCLPGCNYIYSSCDAGWENGAETARHALYIVGKYPYYHFAGCAYMDWRIFKKIDLHVIKSNT
jgi:hypothetical protein